MRRTPPRRRSIARKAAAAALAALVASQAAAEEACFRREDNKRLIYEVFQAGAPPLFSTKIGDYPESSSVYPASDFVTTTMSRLALPDSESPSGFRFEKSFFLWVNRCVYLPDVTPDPEACRNRDRVKGNGYFGIMLNEDREQVRPVFSTYAKADACTLIQLKRVLGDDPKDLARDGEVAGIRVFDGDREELKALAKPTRVASGKSMPYFVDICILEAKAMPPDADAVALDYEVWDKRTPDQAVAIVSTLAKEIRSRRLAAVLITNPIPRPMSGLVKSSVRRVLESVDVFIPTITTGATVGNELIRFAPRSRVQTHLQSYEEQYATLTDDGRNPLSNEDRKRIVWNVGLFDITTEEARQLKDAFVDGRYRGVMISRAFRKQGGACSRLENQVSACLALGRCDGSFGADR